MLLLQMLGNKPSEVEVLVHPVLTDVIFELQFGQPFLYLLDFDSMLRLSS